MHEGREVAWDSRVGRRRQAQGAAWEAGTDPSWAQHLALLAVPPPSRDGNPPPALVMLQERPWPGNCLARLQGCLSIWGRGLHNWEPNIRHVGADFQRG